MNSQPEKDMQLHLQQLEAELDSSPPSPSIISPSQTLQHGGQDSFSTDRSLGRFLNWFDRLSGLGKLIFVGVGAIVGIAVLQAVLKLVAAVISVAILVVLLYVAYQFFVVRSTKTKD